jgi:hypothetical protein
MKTVEEQLLEMRIAFVKSIYNGQPEPVVNAAIKDLDRMNFDSVEDFEEHFKEQFQSNPNREATEEELDSLMDYMGLGRLAKDTRTAEERDLDEIFKNI